EQLVSQTPLLTIHSQSSGQDFTTTEDLGVRFSKPTRPLFGSIQSAFSFGLDAKNYQLDSFNTNTFRSTTVVTNNNTPIVIETVTGFPQPPFLQRLAYRTLMPPNE